MTDLIEEVISTLGAERGFVLLRQGEEWHPLASHYVDPLREKVGLHYSRTVVDTVTNSGTALLSSNAMDERRFQVSSITLQGIRSILCAPLRWSGQVQGVVYADNRLSQGIFKESHLQLFQAITDQASRALEMAALHQQLQRIHQIHASSAETVDYLLDSLRRGERPPEPTPAALAPSRGLVIRLLGTFQVELDGQRLEQWSTRKVRDLLAYLASHGLVNEDKLVDLFWAQGGKSGFHSLHNSVTQLRRRLGKNWLLREFDGYRLAPETWIDTDHFSKSFREGKQAARQGRWEEARLLLGRAEALATGPFLENNPAEWTEGPRQRLSEELLQTRSLLAEHFSQHGKHTLAVELWKRVLQCDTCCEEAYRGLLVALRALGRRAEAVRVYQRCVDAYAQELDLEPPADLEALLDF